MTQKINTTLAVPYSHPDKKRWPLDDFLHTLPEPVWMAVEAVGFVEWFLDRFSPKVDLVSFAAGNRARVNLVRTTRTRFYSARTNRLGSVAVTAVNRGKMNSAAASDRLADACRLNTFRQIVPDTNSFSAIRKEKR